MIKIVFTPLFLFLKNGLSKSVQEFKFLINNGRTNHFFGWCAVLGLCGYVFIICLLNGFSSFFYFTAPLLAILIFISVGKLFLLCDKINVQTEQNRNGITAISLSCLIFVSYLVLIAFLGYNWSSDTDNQWQQVMTGKFDDWHPVVHTFTLYLFSLIFKNIYFVLICMVALFSIVCGWLFSTMVRYHYNDKLAALIVLIIAFGQETAGVISSLWKDAAFATAVLALCTVMIHLWHTKGQWLKSIPHAVFFAFLLFYASFVRHNGIFFTVPVLCFLPLLFPGIKGKLKAVGFSLAVCMILCGYVFARYELTKSGYLSESGKDQKFAESVGIPMCIMSEIYVRTPEKMSPQAVAFMSKINTLDNWRKYYKGDYNSVKFVSPSYRTFQTITLREFLSIFVDTVKADSRTAILAFLHTTSIVWWIDQPFTAPGFIILIFLITGTYAFIKHGWCILFYITPFLAYTWGTALLLNGWDYRFFCGIMVGAVPICAMFLSKERDFTDK